jgi:hypothetical protein
MICENEVLYAWRGLYMAVIYALWVWLRIMHIGACAYWPSVARTIYMNLHILISLEC